MATKRLERTVIEGGRARYCKWHRRYRNRRDRSRRRIDCKALRRDPDQLERKETRREVSKCFRDKLGPAERWLAHQAGRPWDKVHADMMARFDTRSIPGQHVVFDHLLPTHDWRGNLRDGWYVHRRLVFHVDGLGILRCKQRSRSHAQHSWVRHGVETWLDRRRIRQHGDQLYWLEPVLDLLIDATEPRNQRYRQGRRLTDDEAEVVGTFNDAELAAFVER